MPDKAIHEPWKWAEKEGIELDYPRPIVDHKQARLETLAAYEAARKAQDSSARRRERTFIA